MNKQEFIERMKSLKNLFGNKSEYVKIDFVIELASELDEPEAGHADEAPRYVKNILARLRELPLHDREVWLKAIMGEFEQDFSRAKWREGYEQGKVEGLIEREKVTVPQFVADWIKYCKNTNVTLARALLVEEVDFYNYANQKDSKKLKEFLRVKDNQEAFARAWLDGYEVEEKRYMVRMKGVNDYGCYLNKGLLSKEYFWESKAEIGGCRTKHTRKQLEDDDLDWVFDCKGMEVEEVAE